jgi:hypothetical protein
VCSFQQLKIDCSEYPPTFSNAMEEYGLYCWGFQELQKFVLQCQVCYIFYFLKKIRHYGYLKGLVYDVWGCFFESMDINHNMQKWAMSQWETSQVFVA